jgi:hypothetical protein
VTQPNAEDRHPFHPHPNVLLAVLCAATFMSGLDVFIVNVALRPIGAAMHETSLADLSWMLNAYARPQVAQLDLAVGHEGSDFRAAYRVTRHPEVDHRDPDGPVGAQGRHRAQAVF